MTKTKEHYDERRRDFEQRLKFKKNIRSSKSKYWIRNKTSYKNCEDKGLKQKVNIINYFYRTIFRSLDIWEERDDNPVCLNNGINEWIGWRSIYPEVSYEHSVWKLMDVLEEWDDVDIEFTRTGISIKLNTPDLVYGLNEISDEDVEVK